MGRTYPPTGAYVVGREKVREFATAIGDANPAYHDVAAAQALGYSDVVAPPTFAFVIAYAGSSQAAMDPELGLDYSRVVHGEQRFAYSRPIVAGDALVATATIEAIRAVADAAYEHFRRVARASGYGVRVPLSLADSLRVPPP